MSLPTRDFCALILAGGTSSRMGVNKAFLRASKEGPTLMERVLERVLQAGPVETYIIANESSLYESLDLPIVGDDVPGIGPLGGIISGLRASRCERNMVVACDMPNIDPRIIAYMSSIDGECDVIAPRWVDPYGEVRVEPLHAIYMISALPMLRACMDAGDLAIHNCLHKLNVRYADEAELEGFEGATNSFRNINSQGDWLNFLENCP